ncbi:unnamed protein product [Rotaria sordida]|uniref:NHL repeat containing protein n=1 Tax=Rotaria sordida TaxID=392033 RepID=A0A814SQ59_9BILA|nr:unnamed protein product [Rotaria sordida]
MPNFNIIQKQNAWFDHFGATDDHHRDVKKNKTKKCTRQHVLISTILAVIVVIVLLTRIPLLQWNSTGITIIGTTGLSGNTTSQLFLPWGLAFDWSNALYITDQKNNRVQKFLMNMSTGSTVSGYGNGTGSSNLNGLIGPLGIIVDENSNIYVSDNGNYRVMYWPNSALSPSLFAGNVILNSEIVVYFLSGSFFFLLYNSNSNNHVCEIGTAGSSMNQLNDAFGLAHDASSSAIYVADSVNNRIMRFFPSNSSGTLVAGGNGNGINNTQLSTPQAVYFDSLSNSLLIANTGAHNIVRWVLGASNWTLVAGSIDGSNGTSSTRLYSASDVTLDPMGNIYIVDRRNHRIQFFPVGESNGTTIAGRTGISGNNSTLLNFPTSLALDNQLNLYVVDRSNHRIQKYLRY